MFLQCRILLPSLSVNCDLFYMPGCHWKLHKALCLCAWTKNPILLYLNFLFWVWWKEKRKIKAISEKNSDEDLKKTWWGSDYFWSCSCALRGILYLSTESWRTLCWFYILSFSWPPNPAWCKAGIIYFAVFRLSGAPALCDTSCQPFHPIRAEDYSC